MLRYWYVFIFIEPLNFCGRSIRKRYLMCILFFFCALTIIIIRFGLRLFGYQLLYWLCILCDLTYWHLGDNIGLNVPTFFVCSAVNQYRHAVFMFYKLNTLTEEKILYVARKCLFRTILWAFIGCFAYMLTAPQTVFSKHMHISAQFKRFVKIILAQYRQCGRPHYWNTRAHWNKLS